MAYLDLSPLEVGARVRPTRRKANLFTSLEKRVISLSRFDSLNTVVAPSRLSRWLRTITDIRIAPPLADERLEALRRFSVLARFNQTERLLAAADEARSAGFSDRQLAAVRNAVESAS